MKDDFFFFFFFQFSVPLVLIVHNIVTFQVTSNGPCQANLVLIAYASSESRGTFRQKARSLAPLNGWACAVKICHDGMLEDTNSLDGAQIINEPENDKTNKITSATSENSDQSAHPCSLVRVFAWRSLCNQWPNASFCGQRRLIRLCGCPGWSESSLGAHVILLVLSCFRSIYLVLHRPR